MSDEVTRQVAEIRAERDNWQQRAEVLESSAHRVALELTAERDAARADNIRLTDLCNNWQKQAQLHYNNLQRMIGKCDALVAERDAAELERTESRAEVVRLMAELDAAIKERDAAIAKVQTHVAEKRLLIFERNAAKREGHEAAAADTADFLRMVEQRDAARAEAEGLRADLLAHPPEVHQELAAERRRHIELMEDYDRQAVTITMLQEALRRTENALKVAQGRHVDERLKGFLAVISQLADQAKDLLP